MHRLFRTWMYTGLVVAGLTVAGAALGAVEAGTAGVVIARGPMSPLTTATVSPTTIAPSPGNVGLDGCAFPWTQERSCAESVKAVARQPGECALVTIDVELVSCMPGQPPSGQLVVGSVSGWQIFNVADLIGPDGIARWTQSCGHNPEVIMLLDGLGTSLQVTKKCCPCEGPTCCCGLPPGTCDWSRNICDCEPPATPVAP